MKHSRIIEILKSAAFSESQTGAIAEAIDRAFEDTLPNHLKPLATKANVDTLESEAHHMETSLKQDIANLECKMDASIAGLGAKMEIMEARLESKIAHSKSEMIRWMFIFWVGQFAVIKFFK